MGNTIQIDTIDEQIPINIPQGIQTGDKIEIPEKGYKKVQGGRGKLYAEVKVVTPKKLTEEEKKLFQQLERISKFNPRLNKNK